MDTNTNYQVPIAAFIFASSGAAISLLQQQLYYAGAGDGSLLVVVSATFIGTILGGVFEKEARAELQPYREQVPRRMIQCLSISITDVLSLTLRGLALNLCGSGMFTVIYASLPAFNGILSYFVFGTILSKRQWTSMGIVILGLALSAQAEEGSLNERAAHKVALGIVLGIAGTLFSSMSYICVERVLKSPDAPQVPGTITFTTGINDLLIALPWLLGYSLPHRQALLYEPVAEHGWNPYAVLLLWLCLVLANAAHLNTCYLLLQITESVTLTMLQGVRAVMVFGISGALFCSSSTPEQCLTLQKSLCSCMVIFGVVLYAKSTAGLSKTLGGGGEVSNKKEEEELHPMEIVASLDSTNEHVDTFDPNHRLDSFLGSDDNNSTGTPGTPTNSAPNSGFLLRKSSRGSEHGHRRRPSAGTMNMDEIKQS